NVAIEEGRRLAIGWLSKWQFAVTVPTERWRSAMTLPRKLSLHQYADRYELHSQPVEEIRSLQGEAQSIPSQSYEGKSVLFETAEPIQHQIDVRFKKPSSGKLRL
ncbi:MAG: hypothetical protein AAFP02_11370, partial [Bacteroidota bacterium]